MPRDSGLTGLGSGLGNRICKSAKQPDGVEPWLHVVYHSICVVTLYYLVYGVLKVTVVQP